MLDSLENTYTVVDIKQSPEDSAAITHRDPQPRATSEAAIPAPITIVIIEDHLMVADGVTAILDANPDLTVLAVAQTCADGFAAVGRHRPDVLLLDHWLPDGRGVDQIPALLEVCSSMKVLVVTAEDSDKLVVEAINAGAIGVIVKGKRAAVLVAAIRAAARDEAVVTPDVLAQIVRTLTAADPPHVDRRSS